MPDPELAPDGDEEIEATFRRLRREGHSRQDAVQVILDTLDVSLREAKQLLHRSDTWAEARNASEPTGAPSADHSAADTSSAPSAPPPAPG